MRVLPLVVVAIALVAPALAKGDKRQDQGRPLAPSKGAQSERSLSVAQSAEEVANEDESFDMSVANNNADAATDSSDEESSQLSSPSPLAPGQVGVPIVYTTGYTAAEREANETARAARERQRSRLMFSPDVSSLSATSKQRSASQSPPRKKFINPLDLDSPIYRAPSPDTPERVGRRHLALNAPPPDKTFYDRPKLAKERRSNLDIDRRLDRTFHPYFIFDSEDRRKRHNDILQEVKRLLLDLELSTNAHFALFEGRPEKNPAQRDELAHVISSRTIDANPQYRAVIKRFLGEFTRTISTPRRAEHAALLELAQRELASVEKREQARKKAQEAVEASIREAERKIHEQAQREQRVKEAATAKRKTRAAAHSDTAPASDTRRAPVAAVPGPRSRPAAAIPGDASAGRAPAAPPAEVNASEMETVIEVHSDGEVVEFQQLKPKPKDVKGKGKERAQPGDIGKLRGNSVSSSLVPDSEPDRQYEAARLLSLRTRANDERARMQPGASTSREVLPPRLPLRQSALTTPRRGMPDQGSSTPPAARGHGVLDLPERAVPATTDQVINDELPADVRGMLAGMLPRPYWLAIEHIWRTHPARDYVDALTDLNARFELDMDFAFIFQLVILLTRTQPPTPL